MVSSLIWSFEVEHSFKVVFILGTVLSVRLFFVFVRDFRSSVFDVLGIIHYTVSPIMVNKGSTFIQKTKTYLILYPDSSFIYVYLFLYCLLPELFNFINLSLTLTISSEN